jgi:hypothetical protein
MLTVSAASAVLEPSQNSQCTISHNRLCGQLDINAQGHSVPNIFQMPATHLWGAGRRRPCTWCPPGNPCPTRMPLRRRTQSTHRHIQCTCQKKLRQVETGLTSGSATRVTLHKTRTHHCSRTQSTIISNQRQPCSAMGIKSAAQADQWTTYLARMCRRCKPPRPCSRGQPRTLRAHAMMATISHIH